MLSGEKYLVLISDPQLTTFLQHLTYEFTKRMREEELESCTTPVVGTSGSISVRCYTHQHLDMPTYTCYSPCLRINPLYASASGDILKGYIHHEFRTGHVAVSCNPRAQYDHA